MAEATSKKEIVEITLKLSLEEAQDLLRFMGPYPSVGTSYEVYSVLYDLVRGK